MIVDYTELTRPDAIRILNLPEEEFPSLIEAASSLRYLYKGHTVKIQLLTNARSGNCSQNCAYCAQSGHATTSVQKYEMIAYEDLAADSRLASKNNIARHCLGLSGIRFSDREIDELSGHIRRLKKQSTAGVCCSIGFLTPRQALMLKEAGVSRINHNLNTSRNFYPNICTTHTYEERVENIKMLQSVGLEICCGGIVGLGEEKEDVADMLLALRALRPQSVPINFLLPVGGTPLENADTSHLSPEYCLRVLCLARLLLPRSDLRCAGGREVYLKGREKTLFSVVDSVFAAGYLTVGGESITETIRHISEAGFFYAIESA